MHNTSIEHPVNTHFDRDELEKLRERKRSRPFCRLISATIVEHEFRGNVGHPSSYAFVRLECAPAYELSFEVRVAWPSNVPKDEQPGIERAIAESVADALLDNVYQHSGCAVTLVEVRYDDVGSSEVAFMRATRRAMQDLLAGDWKIMLKPRQA
ncbi:MAG TPA: hypothetical protein VK699_01680 [Terriglobales bacterium]|jgi:hypothetical protein|nr:hypothetical protein [Terriglobales bacterium]